VHWRITNILLPAGRAHVLRVTGPDTRWLTGTFVHDGATSNRLLAALPDVIAFERLRERGYEWFDVSYRLRRCGAKESRVRAMPGTRGPP
jgi:hypothetical protein